MSELAAEGGQLEGLQNLILARSADANALQAMQAELKQIQTDYAVLGKDTVRERLAKHLYEKLMSIQDFEYLMYERGLTRKWVYLWYAQEWRSKTIAFAVGATVLFAAVLGWFRVVDTPSNRIGYYAWRLQKPNATDLDLFRAERKFADLLAGHETVAGIACQRLGGLLRQPGLEMARADKVLQLLIVSPHAHGANRAVLAQALVDALRCGNVDIRLRIQSTLEYLVARWGLPPGDAELSQWKPSEGDSVTRLERRIQQWHAVFRASPHTTPAASGPPATRPAVAPQAAPLPEVRPAATAF